MKRGSALLIVLGMLAFIVMSAVAFSAYMRYARLPSSYLRRTSSSRLLAKAALAEAIDIIDTSIGNSRWPGQTGSQLTKNYRRINDSETPDSVIDYWQDRCFIGSNRLVSTEDTVSTLCTEALAYLPPSLINEVRYYSRRSVAAKWHSLGFDSGRFAFTAVDVSDFFDVNRVRANPSDGNGSTILYGRNSSDSGRITLAHAFENQAHTGYTYQPDNWDEFIDQYLDQDKVPLVSLADLNLAMRKQGLPATMSPFCNYIENGANFVTSETGPEAELLRHMNFVTDSYFPVTNRPPNAIDLATKAHQPFVGNERNATLLQLLNDLSNPFLQNLQNKGSSLYNECEVVQLYDYLDEDSVPASLALPTTERTPMITGVSLDGDLAITVEAVPDAYEKIVDDNTKYKVSTYTLKLVGSLEVNVGSVFPFKYDRGTSDSYQLEAAATIAFVPECKPESEGLLRCQNARAPAVMILENGDWNGVNQSWQTIAFGGDKPSVARCRSSRQALQVPTSVDEEKKAVSDDKVLTLGSLGGLAFAANLPANDCYNADVCTFRTCRKVKKEMVNGVENWIDDPEFTDPTPLTDRVGWQPIAKDLSAAIAVDSIGDSAYVPTVQVWVRLVKDSDTVDLVPACWKDDKNSCDILQDARGSLQHPLLRFRSNNPADATVKLEGGAELKGGGTVEIYPKGYLADDPRFNYAPENMWVLDSSAGTFKDEWLKRQTSADGDGDIFMATSDAGYMQSAYEFANILKVSKGSSGFGLATGNGYDGNAGSMPAKNAMWRTYTEYDTGHGYGDIDGLDIINGSRGFRINPYTQSKEIMMAALANTPLGWWAAATNDTQKFKVNTVVHGNANSAAKYSFSEMGSALVKLSYDNLETIAGNMIGTFRNSTTTVGWFDAFDNFGWDDDLDKLCGVTLDNGVKLHSVDRKFLHGFWKECFADRQQLFMVFIRAEPMMMGGGGLGQTPPQLGARAMALVWRDPTPTANDVSGTGTSGGPRPHRTRILFYRQFD